MRANLLLKPHWDYLDICEYVECKKSKAYEIIKTCKEKFNGAIRFNPGCVTRDSVIAYCGSSIERELYVKNLVERREEKIEEAISQGKV